MKFCPLYSGSSGNCIFIGGDNNKVLIDVGLPGKKIDEAMSKINEDTSNIDAIFITHEHSDHIKGVGVISRKYDIPIYANQLTWEAMDGKNLGKIAPHNRVIITEDKTQIGELIIENFSISHDAADPVGYAVYHEDKKACVVTDTGVITSDIINKVKDADILLIESNHDEEMVKVGPYPYPLKRRVLSNHGHLSNENCGKAIIDIIRHRYKHVYLGHLSENNNYPELAYQTVLSVLNENGMLVGSDLELYMAERSDISKVINL